MTRLESKQGRHILECAIRVFADQGMKGATTRLIAEAAKVNSALIYYYYENKEKLFVAAVQMVLSDFLQLLTSREAGLSGGRARIEFLVDGFFDYYRKYPDRMRLMTTVVTAHKNLMAQALLRFLKEGRLVPLEVIREGIGRNELRNLPPIQVWWSVIGICIFALHAQEMVSLLPPGIIPFAMPDFEARRKAIVQMLADGLTIHGEDKQKGERAT